MIEHLRRTEKQIDFCLFFWSTTYTPLAENEIGISVYASAIDFFSPAVWLVIRHERKNHSAFKSKKKKKC